jgi:hypothetical protein
MNLKSKSNFYTELCLKHVFENLTLSRKAPRRSVVNSARGSSRVKPEISLRYRSFSGRCKVFHGRIRVTI